MGTLISRSMDLEWFNALANNEAIRPWLGGDGPLDFAGVIDDPAHIFIRWEHGGWWLRPLMPTVYDLHTMTHPEGRGRAYFAAAREAMRYVFTETDALEIVTMCPDDNAGARMAANLMGFRERFRREAAWRPVSEDNPQGVGISYRVFNVDDFLTRDREIRSWGEMFHQQLDAAKEAAGHGDPAHAEDDFHNRAVGLCVLCILAGQPEKGTTLYNRLALLSGYATISLAGPNLIDVRDAVVAVHNGEMRVLTVRSAPT